MHQSTPVAIEVPTESSGEEVYGALGREVKMLVEFVKDLRHLGVEESIKLPLAKLVLVAEQSAGKSSLIEGLRSALVITPRHDWTDFI